MTPFRITEAGKGVVVIVGRAVGPGLGVEVAKEVGGVRVNWYSARVVKITVSMVSGDAPLGWKTTSSGGLK